MVIGDLEKATHVAKKSFTTPGTVIGFEEDDNGKKTSIYIRLSSGEVGLYENGDGAKMPLVGSRIKGKLPDPDNIVLEPELSAFLYEAINERVKLVPKLWLKSVILKLIDNQPILESDCKKEFKSWVLLDAKYKNDDDLLHVLYTSVSYEGLKGLERYNDKALAH